MSANELPSSSAQAFQEQSLGGFVSRKLLLHNPFDHNTERAFAVAPSTFNSHENNLSGNVLMLLSVLICGIICCLGLHYIIRCAFRRTSSFMISDPISEMNLPGLGEECVICLSDFVSGEQIRMLPKCHHGFHVRCIDKWLQHHLTCPKCRHCLVETCQKILGDFSQADQVVAVPTESVIVRISPLEPASAQSFQEQLLGGYVSRKLLLPNPFDHNSQRYLAVAPSPLITHENNLKGNVLMLLSVLICGIICCLGLHYIIRCAFRRSSSFMISEPISSLR